MATPRETFMQVKDAFQEMGKTGSEAEILAARVVPEGAPASVLRVSQKRRRPRGRPSGKKQVLTTEGVGQSAKGAARRVAARAPVGAARGISIAALEGTGEAVGKVGKLAGKAAKAGKGLLRGAGRVLWPLGIGLEAMYLGSSVGERRKRASQYDRLMSSEAPSVAKELRRRRNMKLLAMKRAQLARADPEAFALLLQAVSGESPPPLAAGEILGGRQPQLSPTAGNDIDSIIEALQ